MEGSTDYSFVSCGGNECLLWEVDSSIINSASCEEIVQPAKILDIESQISITDISALQVMKGAILVLANSEMHQYVFFAKLSKSSSKQKSKVKSPDSTVTLKQKQNQIISGSLLDGNTISTISGNALQISKCNLALIEEGQAIIRKQIDISEEEQKESHGAKKEAASEYNVVGMEESRQINNDFSMFTLDDLKMVGESSRKTSASTNVKDSNQIIQGGSLSTILSQSLISEDKDQLDWIIAQSDQQVIERTLMQIKDPKIISALFSQILARY